MKHAALREGFRTLWNAHPNLPTLVPGGLHHGRVPEDEDQRPYASFDVKLKERIETSGDAIEVYDVVAQVWASEGIDDAEDIEDALTTLNWASGLAVAGATVMGVKPGLGSLDEDPDMREARDVEVCRGAWEVWLQVTQ